MLDIGMAVYVPLYTPVFLLRCSAQTHPFLFFCFYTFSVIFCGGGVVLLQQEVMEQFTEDFANLEDDDEGEQIHHET